MGALWSQKPGQKAGGTPVSLLSLSLLLGALLAPPAAGGAEKVGVLLGGGREGEALLRIEAGRLRGSGGGPIELSVRHSRGRAPAARHLARLLLGDPGVVLLVVDDLAAVARAALAAARPAGAALLSCAPEDTEELEFEDPHLFQVGPGPAGAAEGLLAYFAGRGRERLALIAPLDPFGAKGGELLSALAPAHGVSLLLDARHPDQRRSLSELFRVARDRGAQALVYWGRDGPGRSALNTYRDLGIAIPIALGPSLSRPPWLGGPRRAPEGALVPVATYWVSHLLPPAHPHRRAIEAFRARAGRALGRPPDLREACLSDALSLAARAMGRPRERGAGDAREAVLRALFGVEAFQGVTSRFLFSESARRGAGPEAFRVVRVRGGKVELAP